MSVIASEQIIIELCKETGEPGFMNNQTIWGVFLDGVRDMAIFNMPTWEIIEDLTLNDYNAICWPNGCIKPLITFVTRNGRSLALDVSNDLMNVVNSTITDCAEADEDIQRFFTSEMYEGYRNAWNWGLGEVYGYGSGYNKAGIVTHDRKRRQSFIKGVRLESTDTYGFFCKTDGLNEKPVFVPSECKEPIENFALYKYYRVRNPNLSETFFNKYTQFCYRLSKFNNDDGPDAWSEAVNSNTMSAPKGVR